MAFGFNTYTPPATKNLIIINCLCFLASIALPKFAGIDVINMLGLHYVGAEAFNPVQFLTYMFLHDTSGLTHIFFNMFGLWMFGRAIEEALGTRRFLVFYFVTGVGAAVVQEATWAYTLHPVINALNQYVNTRDITVLQQFFDLPNGARYSIDDILELKQLILNKPVTVGASGCVFGLLLAFAMLFPQAEIFLLFIPIPIKAPIFVGIYALAELFLGVQSFSGDNVAHFAHLGGMLFGLILLLIWRRQDGYMGRN
ncbi:MAG: rhomboid family intramembrane serine protease [Paludibacteraceae bacterium]|nr:rhomboid family intramembrane serine protease [Paludibacteraceae bacterium]